MNIIIWFLQGLLAFIFMFSGINKAYYDERTLVQKGQTGVEGLGKWFIKFIGISEIFGAVGLVAPMFLNKWTSLSSISALCLGLIMIPAAYIHKQRNEYRNVWLNIAILIICFFVAYVRMR